MPVPVPVSLVRALSEVSDSVPGLFGLTYVVVCVSPGALGKWNCVLDCCMWMLHFHFGIGAIR